jgi:hypothetical protein
VKLVDDKKRSYAQVKFPKEPILVPREKVIRIDSRPVAPSDYLFFGKPAADAKELFLELPGENVGVKGTFKFRITPETIKAAVEESPKKE